MLYALDVIKAEYNYYINGNVEHYITDILLSVGRNEEVA